MTTNLNDLHVKNGAVIGAAGVPESFGDPAAAFSAAGEAVILVDRSDEGRLEVSDADHLKIIHRISTNAVEALRPGEGCATVLTTPVGRIIDRLKVHHLANERSLVRTSPQRAGQIAEYLRRNVFFRDRMQINDVSDSTRQLALYGPHAGQVVDSLLEGTRVGDLARHHVIETTFAGTPLLVLALDPLGVPGIGLVIPAEQSGDLWQAVITTGRQYGLRPAGLSTVEQLRIKAGVPGPAGELNESYIPLEAGLWDDVSFSKGCYTGQEIIARLESRGQLAKVLVSVDLPEPVKAGESWVVDGRAQGVLTSVVQMPGAQWIGLGFVKPAAAEVGQALNFESGQRATIREVLAHKSIL